MKKGHLMNIMEMMSVAVGLAMDAFALSLACSMALSCISFRQIFRVAFHFGLFQGMMPVLGWSVSIAAFRYISALDHWAAFGLLTLIGGKAFHDAFRKEGNKLEKNDPTRGLLLLIFSVGTSIDALAVGISLAAIDVDIWQPALIIGMVTLLLATVGMLVGKRIGARFGRRIEATGGIILVGIGIKILIWHTILA